MDLFDFVSNIGEFEFRICFVLRASDFEFSVSMDALCLIFCLARGFNFANDSLGS